MIFIIPIYLKMLSISVFIYGGPQIKYDVESFKWGMWSLNVYCVNRLFMIGHSFSLKFPLIISLKLGVSKYYYNESKAK